MWIPFPLNEYHLGIRGLINIMDEKFKAPSVMIQQNDPLSFMKSVYLQIKIIGKKVWNQTTQSFETHE